MVCPFCKTARTTSKLAVVAFSSVALLAGCDVVTGGAKYGGPPPNFNPQPPSAMTDASPVEPASADASPAPSSSAAANPTTSASSPRLNPAPSERVTAPATKYGIAPKKGTTPGSL